MNDEYRPYPNNRLFKMIDDTYVIIPSDFKGSIPISCPNCSLLMRTAEDSWAWDKHGCCDICAQIWAKPRMNDWDIGWRPSKEEIEDKIHHKKMFTINIEG